MQFGVLLAVAVGGSLGSLLRYFVASAIQSPASGGFPLGIFIVNITGGLAMGLIVELAALKISMSPEVRSFLTVGVLGGYTTFSTFSLDSVLLLQRGAYGSAAAYVIGSVVLSILALFAGLWMVRAAVGHG
jgi:CrcB protein